MAKRIVLILIVLVFSILFASSALVDELSESKGESSVFTVIGPEDTTK